VLVGIFVGEITTVVLGFGYGRLALATFAAMAIARALDASRIAVAQAASSAILTVVALDGAGVSIDRLSDALIGGGVALVFTQILFSPDPLRLLRQAEAAALTAIAENLELVAHAFERDDVALARQAIEGMSGVRTALLELERAGHVSPRVRRHSVLWRSRRAAVDMEAERAQQLDLLGSSCLLLTRLAMGAGSPESRVLAPSIRALAGVIGDLAQHVDHSDEHRRANNRALALARRPLQGGGHPRSPLAASSMILEIIAVGIMSFVGLDPVDESGQIASPPPSE
jgi:hypothetical protein